MMRRIRQIDYVWLLGFISAVVYSSILAILSVER